MKIIRPLALTALLLTLGLAAAARAEVVTEAVPYEHDGQQLEGFLAYDDAVADGDKRPGVLIIHAWWGLGENAKERARMLAELGYVAFALDMYGQGKLTDDPKQASQWAGTFYSDRDLFRAVATAGLDVLKGQPRVDADRLAAIGYCFGGAGVMELAYGGADVKGVVSFHGGLLPVREEDADAADAKVLICHGQADSFYPLDKLIPAIDTLQEAEVDVTTIIYSGAVHAFTDDTTGVELDGVAYDADADRRSWAHMKLFFDELFGDD